MPRNRLDLLVEVILALLFLHLPDDKLSIIVLTNCGSASPEAIVRGVAAFYLPDLAASAAK